MEVLVRFLITRIGKGAASLSAADISGAVSRVTPAAVTEATQARGHSCLSSRLSAASSGRLRAMRMGPVPPGTAAGTRKD